MEKFLSARAGKNRRGTLYGGMLITRLAQSFGILDKHKAMFLTIEPQKAFSPLRYK